MSDDNKTLNEIVSTLISERKRDYRNKILFRIFAFVIFLIIIFLAPISKNVNFNQPHIAVIEINGLIASEAQSSADNIIPLLREASVNESTSVIVIKINSGGGSATQSKIIFDEIVKMFPFTDTSTSSLPYPARANCICAEPSSCLMISYFGKEELEFFPPKMSKNRLSKPTLLCKASASFRVLVI